MLSDTVLSQASAHGHSQLKHQNLGVGGYTEKVLTCKWLNYPQARAHPGCEVGSHGAKLTCIVSSFVLRWGQPDSGEGCIVLQSRPTRSLVAILKFPQHSVVACSTRISCCKGETLQTGPRTGVCEPDVVAPKAHQSYVSSADLPSDSLRKNLAWWAVTQRTLKNHKTVKIGGWTLSYTGMHGHLLRTIRYYEFEVQMFYIIPFIWKFTTDLVAEAFLSTNRMELIYQSSTGKTIKLCYKELFRAQSTVSLSIQKTCDSVLDKRYSSPSTRMNQH